MRKTLMSATGGHNQSLIRPFLKYKRDAIIVVASSLLAFCSITANAQSAKVTLHCKGVTVKTILEIIEKRTNYLFIYGNDIDVNRKVSVNVKDKEVSKVLPSILPLGITYTMKGENISLVRKNSVPTLSDPIKQKKQTISGHVTSEAGEPLVGVTVSMGGGNGTVTDIDGNFTISAAFGETMHLSYIGFLPKSVRVNGSNVRILLSPSSKSLDEVVVIGYGSMKKSDLTGEVVNVTSKTLEKQASFNLMDKLAGQVPGLQITSGNQAPGANQSILIRGENSLSADNTPLIILDGIPYSGSLADLNPNTIESVSVLKDASAAAIYGSRGSNGIILIQSKTGHIGAPHVTYHGEFSLAEPQQRINVMNADQYIKLKQDVASLRDGWTGDQLKPENLLSASEMVNYEKGVTTDWQDIVFRTAFSHNHQIGISGGTEATRYDASLAFLDNKGVVYNSEMKRYNLNLNIIQDLSKWLTIGMTSKFIETETGGYTPNLEWAVKQSPYGIFLDENGGYYYEPMDQGLIRNPMENVKADNDNTARNLILNGFAEIQFPIKGLSYHTNLGYNYRSNFNGTYLGRNTASGKKVDGKASISSTNYYDLTWENIMKYNHTFGKHGLDLTGLFSIEKTQSKKSSESGQSFVTDDMSYYNLNAAEINKNVDSGLTETAMVSYMFRANYTYDNRYLLTLTGRTDGYSAFGENNKYAFFPSVAAGWNIHQEKFMAGTRSWLDQLKLRVSYGANGNQAITPYRTLDRLYLSNYVWGDGASPSNAVYFPNDGMGNPNLKWETTYTFNTGIDFSFLNSRIYGSVNGYLSNTKDLLMTRNVSIMNGYNKIWDNIGKTRNWGIELSLHTLNLQHKDFLWRSDLVFSMNRDEIRELRGDGMDDISNKWFIGHPLRVYYDYKVIGLWQEGDEFYKTDENGKNLEIQKGAKPGSAKLMDANHDGVINSEDKVIIGSKQPQYLASFNNEFTYKNFYLQVLLNGTFKVWRELNEANVGSWTYNIYNYIKDADYWTPEHTDAKYPSPSYNNFDGHTYYHEFSYVQIKNITLGYNFDKSFVQKLHMSGLSANLSIHNAYTFCNIRSMLNYDNSWFASYPTARSYVLGVNITF